MLLKTVLFIALAFEIFTVFTVYTVSLLFFNLKIGHKQKSEKSGLWRLWVHPTCANCESESPSQTGLVR